MCSCSVDLQKAENGSDGISWTGPVRMRVDHCLQEPMVKMSSPSSAARINAPVEQV